MNKRVKLDYFPSLLLQITKNITYYCYTNKMTTSTHVVCSAVHIRFSL
jgi:hypothetical protein